MLIAPTAPQTMSASWSISSGAEFRKVTDQGIPVSSIERMRAALEKAGKTAEIIVYPDTPRAFFADYRPSYRKEAAQDGWKRMLAWFKKHGVA